MVCSLRPSPAHLGQSGGSNIRDQPQSCAANHAAGGLVSPVYQAPTSQYAPVVDYLAYSETRGGDFESVRMGLRRKIFSHDQRTFKNPRSTSRRHCRFLGAIENAAGLEFDEPTGDFGAADINANSVTRRHAYGAAAGRNDGATPK